MNFTIGQMPEVVGAALDLNAITGVTRNINRLLAQYPKGSGNYSGLVAEEQNAASLIADSPGLENTSEGTALINAHNKLRSLLESEMAISINRRVSHGVTTEAQEQKGLEKFNIQRQENIESLLTPEAGSKKSFLTTVLTFGAIGLGAYMLFKN